MRRATFTVRGSWSSRLLLICQPLFPATIRRSTKPARSWMHIHAANNDVPTAAGLCPPGGLGSQTLCVLTGDVRLHGSTELVSTFGQPGLPTFSVITIRSGEDHVIERDCGHPGIFFVTTERGLMLNERLTYATDLAGSASAVAGFTQRDGALDDQRTAPYLELAAAICRLIMGILAYTSPDAGADSFVTNNSARPVRGCDLQQRFMGPW